MIGLKGTMVVIDNSGALIAECVNVLKAKNTGKALARIGDEVVVVVQKARPQSQTATSSGPVTSATLALQNKVRRGDIRRAVIVRTKKETRRADGRYVRFDDNACVLLNNKKEPLGTRVNGVVAQELREKGWGKILSMAPKVV